MEEVSQMITQKQVAHITKEQLQGLPNSPAPPTRTHTQNSVANDTNLLALLGF
jgi:hypothetical protein